MSETQTASGLNLAASDHMRRATDAVMAAMADLERGDSITHDRIEEASGISYDSEEYKTLIDHVKRRMLDDRGIELWAIVGEGYRLSTYEDQIVLNTREHLRRAARCVRRVRKSMEALVGYVADLTPHQQRLRVAKLQAAEATEEQIRRDARIDRAREESRRMR